MGKQLVIPLDNPFPAIRASTIGHFERYPILSRDILERDFAETLIPSDFDGQHFPINFLDNGASTRQIGMVWLSLHQILKHYANTHSFSHWPAEITNENYELARHEVMQFVNADPETHWAVFVGTGATGAIDMVLRIIERYPDPERGTIITTEMEHHANLMPWQDYAERHGQKLVIVPVDRETGAVHLESIRDAILENRDTLRLVAISAFSNVTGIINQDLGEIAKLTREVGAQTLVDAAQALAHYPIDVKKLGIDFLVGSGHKIYAPGSPGILIMPKMEHVKIPPRLGGGIPEWVDVEGFELIEPGPELFEAGTPNIVGAIMLGVALRTLRLIGMDRVWQHEYKLTRPLLEGLANLDGVTVYGDTDIENTLRGGVVSFNIAGLPAPIVSKELSLAYATATRHGCFCANPYGLALQNASPEAASKHKRAVTIRKDRSQLPELVRVALAIYSNSLDVARFLCAIKGVRDRRDRLLKEYKIDKKGRASRHGDPAIDLQSYLAYPIVTGGNLVFPGR